MSAEDEALKARIAAMAGQINRHKNQQAGFAPPPPHYSTSQRGGYNARFHRPAPYQPRYRGSSAHVHRHKTLVLNGGAQQGKPADADTSSDSSSSTWVQKNDRHLQLINKSVYDQEAQSRIQAIEQTRRQKLTARDQQERSKLQGYLQHSTAYTGGAATNQQGPVKQHTILVADLPFVLTKNGSKLVRAPGNDNPKATPKSWSINGVKFYRSKNGNLIRQGIVKAQRRLGVKKVDVPCRMFSMTGTSLSFQNERVLQKPQLRNNTRLAYGSCPKGPNCRYKHDPWRTAACKEFAQKGECKMGDACDLSHELTPERMPTCLHYVRDQCTNPNCKYGHADLAPGAPVCRSFGLYGYCEKGAKCPERHAFECPDFSNTGVCKTKGCKLLHREKASVQRKQRQGLSAFADDDQEMEDIDSDDDGETITSDDVDSDGIDEFIGPDDNGLDFEMQKDYIAI